MRDLPQGEIVVKNDEIAFLSFLGHDFSSQIISHRHAKSFAFIANGDQKLKIFSFIANRHQNAQSFFFIADRNQNVLFSIFMTNNNQNAQLFIFIASKTVLAQMLMFIASRNQNDSPLQIVTFSFCHFAWWFPLMPNRKCLARGVSVFDFACLFIHAYMQPPGYKQPPGFVST